MENQNQLKSSIIDFLHRNEIRNKISEMVRNGSRRLVLNLNDLTQIDPNLAKQIKSSPLEILPFFDETLKEMVDESYGNPEKQANQNRDPTTITYSVSFEGSLGRNSVTPRGLLANLANQYVAVTGVVTKMTSAKPKLNKSYHYCEDTDKISVKTYEDSFKVGVKKQGSNTTNFVPKKDFQGNSLSMEFGLSTFTDYQTVIVQEAPERLPFGQLPRSVEVILENDLVDKIKPGDRLISNKRSNIRCAKNCFYIRNCCYRSSQELPHWHFYGHYCR